MEFFHSMAQKFLAFGVELAMGLQKAVGHFGIGVTFWLSGEAFVLEFARAEHALADRLRRLGALVAAELLVFDGRSFDMNIDAVEQRSGDAIAVIFHLLR